MLPLRVRSYYSLMRGLMSPAEICRRARAFGNPSVALTDRDNLYGLWQFLAACKREKLRPIIGSEVSEPGTDRMATCLVKSETGYNNLCRLLSRRHADKHFQLAEELPHHTEGLLILSQDREVLEALQRLGLNPVADLGAWPVAQSSKLKKWAEKSGIRATATHDCGIAEPEHAEIYMLLRAIDTNTSISKIREELAHASIASFAAPNIYEERFAMWPEVIEESHRLASLCDFTGPKFDLVMPPWEGDDPDTTLREWAYSGARRRYGADLGEIVVERLEHELQVIASMGFSSYFLVVRNIVHRLEENGRRKKRRICGRGSGAASLVAYCLEITNVCPIKYNLYFERFLNPGRSDPPDIDIDFAWDERDEVLAEVLQDHQGYAAMVCNHIFFKPRMAIREVAKAYGMPGYEISHVTKKLPWLYTKKGDLFQQIEKMPTLRGVNLRDPWPFLIKLASRIVGIPRYLSVHPGGVVITPKPIDNYVPIEHAPKGVPIIQWEKDGAEEAGLVKIDLLGNRSLGVIRDCIASVRARGVAFDEHSWEPEDDVLTQESVSRGITMGCFYIESPAMRLLQKKAGTGDYEQLVIQSSIIRPAANEFVREYVRRLHGGKWQPLHPELGDVLDETFGLMVYQEDVSRVAVKLAGFSHARADGLRKIMSKKDKEYRLADYKHKFYAGCSRKNIGREEIDKMWEMMMSFDGYSFCKPHSASYARVSFQAAYLKTYFSAEFMAAVISNQGGYYSTFAYVSEAKRLNVKILPPDVNLSDTKWKGRNGKIRVGLQAVHGVSGKLMERIISERSNGSYRDAADFFHRTRPAEDEARQLIHAGALDSLQVAPNRTVLLWELASYRRLEISGKHMSLFEVSLPPAPPLSPPRPRDRLRREYEALGFLCDTHPVVLFAQDLGPRVVSSHLSNFVGKRVGFLGWLLTGKLVSTKTGEAMEFLTFEDEHGLVETTFFPKVYQRYAHILQTGRPYVLRGLVESDFGAITLTVEGVETLKN
ncbi:MAG: DNA polymerase III subunit alpha [Desulfocapsaceae bacterium]|nr:DNA polymerase III subunit alpha [Desulfocapsaceae bacterium]